MSEGCRAAHTQPDNEGFSSLLWGWSTTASVLTWQNTFLSYRNTDEHILPGKCLYSSSVWGSSSRSGFFPGRRRKKHSTSSSESPGFPSSSPFLCLHSVLPLTLSCQKSTYINCFPFTVSISLTGTPTQGSEKPGKFVLVTSRQHPLWDATENWFWKCTVALPEAHCWQIGRFCMNAQEGRFDK